MGSVGRQDTATQTEAGTEAGTEVAGLFGAHGYEQPRPQ